MYADFKNVLLRMHIFRIFQVIAIVRPKNLQDRHNVIHFGYQRENPPRSDCTTIDFQDVQTFFKLAGGAGNRFLLLPVSI